MIRYLKSIFIFLLAFLVHQAGAQIDLKKVRDSLEFFKPKSTAYIHVNDNLLTFKCYYHFPGMSVRIKNQARHLFIYRPNVRDNIGVEVSLKGLSMATSLQLPSRTANTSKFGPTQFTDFQTNITTRSVNVSLDFRKFKGLYAPISFYNYEEEKYKRKDIQVSTFGVSAYFLTSGKLSLTAARNQTEKQLKSAGSFTLVVSERGLRITADSSLVPDEQLAYYDEVPQIARAFYNTLALSPGYTYTYVYKNYFVTAMTCVGPALMIAANKLYEQDRREWLLKLTGDSHLMLAAGIHGERLLGQVIWELSGQSIPLKVEKIRHYYQSLKIGVGVKI